MATCKEWMKKRYLEKFWKKKKRKTSKFWLQEVTTGMKEKGINDMEWVDREE